MQSSSLESHASIFALPSTSTDWSKAGPGEVETWKFANDVYGISEMDHQTSRPTWSKTFLTRFGFQMRRLQKPVTELKPAN